MLWWHLLMAVKLGGVLLDGQLLLVQALVQVVNEKVLILLDPLQVLGHAISSIGLPASILSSGMGSAGAVLRHQHAAHGHAGREVLL